jgi:nucleoside-diphosphate-sugar epimerase
MTASRPVSLVTGAAGFIGAHLCRRLAAMGHEVVAIDVNACPRPLAIDGVRFIQADLRDTGRFVDELGRVRTVFHLASVHLQVGAREEEYRAVNRDATVALATSSHARGVRRFVHVSTVGIFGHVEHPPATEDAPRRPTNAYERTKLEGEVAVQEAADRLGLDLRVLRPAWVYGPGCRRTARLVRTIRRRRFVFIGDGTNLRHPVFVSYVVDALVHASERDPGERRDHLIAGPAAMPLRALVNTCAAVLGVPAPGISLPRQAALALGRGAELGGRLLGKEPPFSRRSLAFFENDNAFDCSAARRDLGYEPRVDFAEGLRLTLADPTWPLVP